MRAFSHLPARKRTEENVIDNGAEKDTEEEDAGGHADFAPPATESESAPESGLPNAAPPATNPLSEHGAPPAGGSRFLEQREMPAGWQAGSRNDRDRAGAYAQNVTATHGAKPQQAGGSLGAHQEKKEPQQQPHRSEVEQNPPSPTSADASVKQSSEKGASRQAGKKDLPLEEALRDGTVTYQEATQLYMPQGLAEQILKEHGITPATADSWAKNQGVDIDNAGFWSNGSWSYLRKQHGLEGKSNREVAEFMAAKANAYNARVEIFKAKGGADRDRIKVLFALYDLASVATLPLALPSAGSIPWVGAKLGANVGKGVPPMMSVAAEAKAMLTSGQMKRLIEAHKAGKVLKLMINGRPVQVQPGLPFSGFSNFREGGFVLGDEAFTSAAELEATLVHELTRLRSSVIFQSGASTERAATETAAAAAAAKQATGR